MIHVRISMAMTADGKTADEEGEWYPLCQYERERFYRNIEWSDAVVVGADTVLTTNISFLSPSSLKNPLRAVIDPKLKTPIERKVYDTLRGPVLIFSSKEAYNAKRDKIEKLNSKGIEIVTINEKEGYLSTKEILNVLKKRGCEKILVVGGGRTNWFFLKEGLVDEFYITVTPYILGNTKYSPVSGSGFPFPGIKLELLSMEKCPCGEEVILKYKVHNNLQNILDKINE
ncbi:dihydrofolate reductase family protein [Fervidicoccus fontis]|jgi:2,5-diamino-6-(ribosylamino)-4(3H)-pyrimidinone 5'-phosphate reductase|uniref:2, 5-diamino-6-hydroxy-4-(5-phosphoribosylamino)pyrimidine 1-reductase n=2 Tax=Fervidicoccus fontis TaxID=683846 RepID=I0A1I8_FERFK|nr:dihydrofolate reductase family protein [Fervidicoccus fontis]AFH42845.1 2, 5-diamino-6-hydroxy-4-(5-phosphoribosylamino)pyrimidine 1-reductase [Fervidicoccus fontis Kam940]MBE9391630.1 dihydrofolate reductase family protein [Fervidicoccus fontis]